MENEVKELSDWFDELAMSTIENNKSVDIIIDDEIKNRLWPLNEQEYNNLEQSILNEGCREKLIVWENILIDGHNRYEICKKHNKKYETVTKQFENKNQVLKWVDTNQLSRRNITDEQRTILYGRISKINKQEGFKGNQYESGNGKVSHNQKQQASELKVDVKTLYNAEKYVDAIEDIERSVGKETTNKILSGDLKISKQDIVKIAKLDPFEQEKIIQRIQDEGKNVATIIKQGEIAQIKNDIETGKFILPEGKFQVIMMDVPWPYDTEYDESNIMGRSATPYPLMTMEEIYGLNIPDDDNTILFFWTTQKFLEESFKIIKSYGYEYKATLVWDKVKMGIGKTLRLQCEFCLICFKGNPIWKLTNMRDIISEPRREHSRKPDIIYDIINESLIGRKLDYFSRENREGWETFGYEKYKKEYENYVK